jgi:hypothetical protein
MVLDRNVSSQSQSVSLLPGTPGLRRPRFSFSIQIFKERPVSLPNCRTEVQLFIWKVLNTGWRSELSGSAGLNYPVLPVNNKVRRLYRQLGKSLALLESLRFPSGAARYSSLLSVSTEKTEVFSADPRSLKLAKRTRGPPGGSGEVETPARPVKKKIKLFFLTTPNCIDRSLPSS